MGKLNMDAMKSKLADESQSNYSSTDYDRLETGKNVRRVLWPKGDSDSFYSEGYIHYGLGADGRSIATCPTTWDHKAKCPICEYVEQLQQSKSKEDQSLANDIKKKRCIYINVLNRDEEEEKPKVLRIGVTILKGILELICDADYGDITDPEEGRDITITKKGKGLKTEYNVLPKPKASTVSEDLDVDEIEEEMTDLDSLFIKKSYEELLAVLNDDDYDEDDDEDEDEDDYDSLDLDELKALCKERGISVTGKANRLKLITLLTKFDEASEDEDEDDDEDEDEDIQETDTEDTDDEAEDEDDVQDAIAAALAKRKKRK